MAWQDRYGWKEISSPTDGDISASGGFKIWDNVPQSKTLIRRIRGSASGGFDLVAVNPEDTSQTIVLESLPGEAFDIPGLELSTPEGWDLHLDGSANNVTDAYVRVQIAQKRVIDSNLRRD